MNVLNFFTSVAKSVLHQENTTHLFNAYSTSEYLFVLFHDNQIDLSNAAFSMKFYKVEYHSVLVHKRNPLTRYMTIVEEREGQKKIFMSNFSMDVNCSYIIKPNGDVIQSLINHIYLGESDNRNYRLNSVSTPFKFTESETSIEISGKEFESNITHLCNVYPESNHLFVYFHQLSLDPINAGNEKFYEVQYGEVLKYNRSENKEYMTVAAGNKDDKKILFSNSPILTNLSYIITPEGKALQSLYSSDKCNIWIGHEDQTDYQLKLKKIGKLFSTTHILTTEAKTVLINIGNLVKNSNNLSTKKLQFYDIDPVIRKKRGRCLILNYKDFKDNVFSARNGTEFDYVRLQLTFKKLDFDVNVCHDLSYEKTLLALKEGNVS